MQIVGELVEPTDLLLLDLSEANLLAMQLAPVLRAALLLGQEPDQ